MKLDLLQLICRAVHLSSVLRSSFQDNGGYVATLSCIISLEKSYENPISPLTDFTIIEKTLVIIFKILIRVIKGKDENRNFLMNEVGVVTFVDSLKLTCILDTRSAYIAFSGLIALAFEDDSILDNRDNLTNSSSSLKNASFLLCALQLLPLTITVNPDLVTDVLALLKETSIVNIECQIALKEAGVVSTLISWLFDDDKSEIFSKPQLSLLNDVAKRLIAVGLSDEDLRKLITKIDITHNDDDLNPTSNTPLLQLILHGLQQQSPHFIEMDLNSSDYSCLVLDNVSPSFPPNSGYTFLSWFRVKRFEASTLPIFGIFDQNETSRLMISINFSKKLWIKTFKSSPLIVENFVFEENTWYHIAIVHQKSRITSSSISIYINSNLVSQTKLPYPGQANSQAQAFIGVCPYETKIPNLKYGVLNVAQIHFIEDELLDLGIIVNIYLHGYDYVCNFQGDLQTSKKNTKKSVSNLKFSIVNSKTTIPEQKIIVSIIPQNYVEIVSKQYANESNSVIQKIASTLEPKCIINSIRNDSVSVAQIKGKVVVSAFQRLTDLIWKIGSCSVLLQLVHVSKIKLFFTIYFKYILLVI